MARMSLQTLGRKLNEKRSSRGIREVANEIGVSPSTLSRIERGYLPDLETFGKICKWLNVNPGEMLGMTTGPTNIPNAMVQFKKDQTIAPETAQALAQMILAAHQTLGPSEDIGGSK